MSTPRNAMPGLMAGNLGLVAGAIGMLLDRSIFGVVAGVLAVAAGVAGMRLAQQIIKQQAAHTLIEAELQKVQKSFTQTEERVNKELERLEPETTSDSEDVLLDQKTGLFSESFFLISLDSRVAAARRHLRPVSVVLMEVVNGLPSSPSLADPETIVPSIKDTLREADTACRLTSGNFALLLEDTPENGAIWTVERIRRHLSEAHPETTIWAGVACYPAHAFSPDEIIAAAEDALTAASEWKQDRIEVAVVAAD